MFFRFQLEVVCEVCGGGDPTFLKEIVHLERQNLEVGTIFEWQPPVVLS